MSRGSLTQHEGRELVAFRSLSCHLSPWLLCLLVTQTGTVYFLLAIIFLHALSCLVGCVVYTVRYCDILCIIREARSLMYLCSQSKLIQDCSRVNEAWGTGPRVKHDCFLFQPTSGRNREDRTPLKSFLRDREEHLTPCVKDIFEGGNSPEHVFWVLPPQKTRVRRYYKLGRVSLTSFVDLSVAACSLFEGHVFYVAKTTFYCGVQNGRL